MSGIMLNLDFNGSGHDGRQMKPAGNAKHRRFVKKRRHLERRGLLNKKQNTNNFRKEGHGNNQWHKQNKRKDDSQAGAVFPKFSSGQCELSMKSSSSVQTDHGNCAAETDKESIVPSSSTSYRESTSTLQRVVPSLGNPQKYIALDCEMVGTGPKGHCSELARCSIVTYDGDVIYDKFIKPVNLVTDYRTRWSGIRKRDLYKATPFKQAQREILKILSGKVVVGHDVQNDFKVLHYSHPDCLTRDTSRMPLLNQKAGLPEDRTASLKILTKLLFNKDIQVGKKGHSSVEDAKATMELYKLVELEWERTVASKSGH
ncbi:interferon-stimulated 20 kDa exonuclease-like 2 [Colossoma macropomum]|uniref:interferon-stimulated 20 kDa exonuclease-like 2 n=1 Tax=Colossoma macropomum TaxID=42526 RepID=UPI0018649206|nr:interferon-stimulated 20 kDa exonuclease-like 2 [Colossoma macropomum]XP_036440070.1 interferon-stimulated 20 kDa exonuclease-like 2 [Colossoma macropomum]